MKRVSVDCEFNRLENIRSNPGIENLKCYNKIKTGNRSEYTFNIDFTNIKVIQEEETTKIETHQKIVVNITINDTPIKVMVIVPNNINSLLDAPLGTEILNYYIYEGLDPSSNYPLKTKIVIGKLEKNNQEKIVPKFNNDFKTELTNNLTIYKKIGQCVQKIGAYNGVGERERMIYNSKIIKCYREFIEPNESDKEINKWLCMICNKQYGDNIDKCPECGIITQEHSKTYTESKSSGKSTSKTTNPTEKPKTKPSSKIMETIKEEKTKKITTFKRRKRRVKKS